MSMRMRKTRSVHCSHMSALGSGCSLPIRMDRWGQTAHPIMRCLVSMGWLGSDISSASTSPFSANTNITARRLISIMSAQSDRARPADCGAITPCITLSGDCLSTFNANHVTLNALIQRAEATDRKEQLVSKIKRVRGTSRPVETGSRKNARWKVAWSSQEPFSVVEKGIVLLCCLTTGAKVDQGECRTVSIRFHLVGR